MFSYLSISTLNDFVFCPYSIYLHNVYKEGSEDNYHAMPQVAGKNAHQTVDRVGGIQQKITGLEVFSEELELMGKIDLFDPLSKSLIERKRKLKYIYQGQIWQLQAQYFCMIEMGYSVDSIGFYSMADHKSFPQPIPSQSDKNILKSAIEEIKNFDFLVDINVNPNKCRHCIYNNLCDKTEVANTY